MVCLAVYQIIGIALMMRINPDKRIGHVLFLVEGERTEFQYLRRIFERLLNYTYCQTKRNGEIKLSSLHDEHSCVLVLNTSGSYIASIAEGGEHAQEDLFFSRLQARLKGTGFRLNAARIYYIFDRDPHSNASAERIKSYLSRFSNATDNNEDRAGLLLLSYPSVEAHLVSHFISIEGQEFELGKELKHQLNEWRSVHNCQLSHTNKGTLLHATEEFLSFFERELAYSFELDKQNHGLELFEHQEAYYQMNSKFKLMSQLVQALLDLGIIACEY